MAHLSQRRWGEHQRAFVQLAQQNTRHGRVHEVFADLCELSALEFSCAVDPHQAPVRQSRLQSIAKRYDAAALTRFAQMLGCVVLSLEAGLHDCLGQLFMGLEHGDDGRGQFFTLFEVSRLMAGMLLSEDLIRKECARHGYITLCEPAVGAGGMVIAAAAALQSAGLHYPRELHVTAIDIDPLAVHMAYLQLSLLHIPALVMHGNALSGETWSHWATPAHVLGMWDTRLRHRAADSHESTVAQPGCAPMPLRPAPDVAQVRAAVVDTRTRWEQTSLF